MKKIVVAGASILMLGVAAVPFTGVFAADVTSHTDIVTVTVTESCTMSPATASGWDATTGYSVSLAPGGKDENITGTTLSVSCNYKSGWTLTAAGSQTGTANAMIGSGDANGKSIASGMAMSGDTSNWAFKVTGTGASGYTDFTTVPATAKTVASGTGQVSGNIISTAYRVYIGPTQTAGTYTGKVTYTLAKASA